MTSEMTHGKCIVALLDVLGARTHDIEMTERVFEQTKDLRGIIEEALAEMQKPIDESNDQAGSPGPRLPAPEYRRFGDTVLLLWHVGQEHKYLPFLGYALSNIFVDALNQGIPLRGALGYGDVAYDKEVAVGPAISDVAEWYEEADALGVLVTPRTGLLLDAYRKQNPEFIAKAFTKHNIPLTHEEKKRELWAISWPVVLQEKHPEDPILRETLLSLLHDKFTMPKKAVAKYYNMLEFYDHCMGTPAD